jgi:hypothetical protein
MLRTSTDDRRRNGHVAWSSGLVHGMLVEDRLICWKCP